MPEHNAYNGLTHMELVSDEVERTVEFYREVFGWKFNRNDEMDYTLFEAPGGLAGGVRTPMEKQGERPGTFDYLLVDSADEYAVKIQAAGGKILAPKQEVPGFGYFVVFMAPGGIVQAVWENIPHGGAKEFS